MKGPLVVAALVVVVLVAGAGAYLFFDAPSPSTSRLSDDITTSQTSSSTTISIPQTQSTQSTTYKITATTAQVTAGVVNCNANQGTCVITLVNAGGTSVEATSCTLNGQPGVFAPAPINVPPGGSADVSCAPPKGGAIPIPGFHVEGLVQLSDGSSVSYASRWA
jgi:hypothetical protein